LYQVVAMNFDLSSDEEPDNAVVADAIDLTTLRDVIKKLQKFKSLKRKADETFDDRAAKLKKVYTAASEEWNSLLLL
jgi:hypothetical protein